MTYAADGSQVPTYGLGGALLACGALLAIGAWLWIATRRSADALTSFTVAVLLALSAAFGTAFAEGMRHYGGSSRTSDGLVQNCDVWWQEAGLGSDQRALEGDLSPDCRHAAIAAIWPGVLTSLLVGIGVGAVVFGIRVGLGRVRARRGPRVRRSVGRIVE